MKKSESTKAIFAALVQAQAEMPPVKMNQQNPFLKNKYADLGAVIETSRPVLAKFQLAMVQNPVSENGRIGVSTTLIHSSGEWIEEVVFIDSTDSKGLSTAQNAGVVISYLRRYSWSSMLGLYADEDTDGHKPEAKQEKPTDSRIWTKEQKQALIDAKLAKDEFAAKGMLGLSILKQDATKEQVVAWGTLYRSKREAETATVSAMFANEQTAKAGK